ncbi:MAG: CheR family methyltransferase [bacterium]
MGIKKLTDNEFKKIRKLVYENIGVNLTEKKRALIISRLSRRLRKLNLYTFNEYIKYLNNNSEEIETFFNLITTNVTHFFREENHFNYLRDIYLPELKQQENKIIRVWSAGCSTGEEPYTLALVLYEYFKEKNHQINILASDINTDVLNRAAIGIYKKEAVENISYEMLTTHFKLGIGKNKGLFKIKDHIKKLVTFKKINLTTVKKFPIKKKLDIIFCRNVFIYFNQKTQRQVLNKFHDYLKANGRLFMGHSERINPEKCGNKCWQMCKPTIYRPILGNKGGIN